MKGTFVVEHFNESGEKITPDYYGENTLRSEPFNTIFYNQFQNVNKKYLDVRFNKMVNGSYIRPSEQFNQQRWDNTRRFTGTGINEIPQKYFISLLTADNNITDSKPVTNYLTFGGSRSILTSSKDNSLTNKAIIFSYTKEELWEYISTKHNINAKSAKFNSMEEEKEHVLNSRVGIPYNKDIHRILVSNDKLNSVATDLIVNKPVGDQHRIDYKITISASFKNTLTTPIPISAITMSYGPPIDYNPNSSRYHLISATDAFEFYTYLNSSAVLGTFAHYNKTLGPGEELRINYTLTFEFFFPVAGQRIQFKKPEKLLTPFDNPNEIYTATIYFIREYNDNKTDDSSKIEYSDKDILVNAFSPIECRYIPDAQRIPKRYYGFDWSTLNLSDFVITKIIPSFNQETIDRNNLYFRLPGEISTFRLVSNVPFTQRESNPFINVKTCVPPFFLINSMNQKDITSKTWYNWLIVFDKPFDSVVNGTRIDALFKLALPKLSFLHDVSRPESLTELEATI